MTHKKPHLKILLVQVANMNLGDQVLADNDEYLLRLALFPRRYDILRYSISSRDIGQVRYVDAVVFAGGIMKVTNEYFWQWVPELIREAERYGVPVFMSAIGCEQFYPEDPRSIELKEALNLSCVKGISCRDDIETLRRDYITNPAIRVTAVTDPAVWCRQTYRDALRAGEPLMVDTFNPVRPTTALTLEHSVHHEEVASCGTTDEAQSASQVSLTTGGVTTDKQTLSPRLPVGYPIGLGAVREHLFADYGNPEMDGAAQLAFWLGVIRLLEAQGTSWVLFTNGDRQDEEMAERVLEAAGHGMKVSAPRDGADLATMISHFSGVIAGRMHSNIIAYSLGIPSIGFIWNRKLRFWSEKIGHPERFLEIGEMTPDRAVEALGTALGEKTGPGLRQRLPVLMELRTFVRKHVRYRKKVDILEIECLGKKLREEKTEQKEKNGRSEQTGLHITSEESPDKICHNRIRFEDRLVATALGGIDLRYRNTNSPDALIYSIQHGYTKFQLDLRLTSDRELVCVNRWHQDTYRMLGLPDEEPSESSYRPPVPLETFLSAKCYRRFRMATFEEVAGTLKHGGESGHDIRPRLNSNSTSNPALITDPNPKLTLGGAKT